MELITCDNAIEYLQQRKVLGANERVQVRELPGGVSNLVLYVTRDGSPSRPDLVLKQARPQLRVADPWFCSVERIWREVDVLRICDETLAHHPFAPAGRYVQVGTPRVLEEDRDNFLFIMTAAPEHEVWKQQLLRGETVVEISQGCGRLLGALHGATWKNPDIAKRLGDRTFFEDLRVDPYYRQVSRVHEDSQPAMDRLIASLEQHPRALVHGDFSPKNLLVFANGLMLVDCEVGHYGDPAFDLGFLLSHLILKSVYAGQAGARYRELAITFWEAYLDELSKHVTSPERNELEARGIANFLGCAWARVDGKSKVEYLSECQRDHVRHFCRQHLPSPPTRWAEMNRLLERELDDPCFDTR